MIGTMSERDHSHHPNRELNKANDTLQNKQRNAEPGMSLRATRKLDFKKQAHDDSKAIVIRSFFSPFWLFNLLAAFRR